MQILAAKPSKLLLIEQSEFALYSIHERLEASRGRGKTALVPLLASVQNAARIGEIMSTWRPDTVYHAAAYKHVPLVEHNPAEGIRNNVFGTLQMALAAVANKVGHFVLVSTDKAVRPTNMMGVSKRLAEVVLKSLSDSGSSTIFSIVRFGNVLGSSGSVVPKFFSQIQAGGPITLTHPEVTRFFMTPSEAAQLVIQAGAMGTGGDIFILDMGEPVRIRDLARRMVHLSGLSVRDELNPEGDISFEITGLRLGEKLHEELLIREGSEPTGHPRILRAREDYRVSWEKLALKLQELEESLNPNSEIRKGIALRKRLWLTGVAKQNATSAPAQNDAL
jgi:FlaA1/EpsC-like NDP-sugar epimerase